MHIMHMLKVKKRVILVFALIFLIGGSQGTTAQEGPLAQIKQTLDEMVAILNNPNLIPPEMAEERQQRITNVVQKRFDFDQMARLTLGRHWRDLSRAEQEKFTELFADLLRNTYVSRVDLYYEHEISVSFRDQEIRDGRAVVSSIVTTNSTNTPISYRLSEKNGEWLVYDVVIEGVSMIRNYRTQFSRIIEKEKFAGLIRRIEERIDSGEAS
jgi:phospholipid transport system substrate-binding protein